MSSVIVLQLFLIFITVLRPALAKVELKCGPKYDSVADEEFSKLIVFTHPNIQLPESEDNVKGFCAEYTERVRILGNYVKNCKKGLPKQILSVIVYTVRLQVKNLCKKNSRNRPGLMTAAKCANFAKTEFTKCGNELIDTLQGILKADDKKKIPHTCCAYFKFTDCFQTRGQNVKQCSQDNLDKITDFIEDVAANALSLICGDYVDGSDKCTKLEAPPKKDKNTKRSKSFFKPFIQVFDSFAEITE